MKRSTQTRPYPPVTSAPPEQDPVQISEDVTYMDYSQTGFEEQEYSDFNEELDDTHRFRVAMSVFNLISILAGLALILVMVAILISLITWLQGDITQSVTLLTSNLQ
ncbi:MAG: hypothetical protein LLF96_04110 [Eubacteriales bacterium]|nr:hypothetical protein [Eubacteriales bacterium]